MAVVQQKRTESNPWRTAQHQFDEAAEILKLDPGLRKILREVQREFTCHFPVQMDDKSVRNFTGFRIQHNINRGPAKGGLRFHPDVSLDGAKGGVIVDPYSLSANELEHLTRRFATEISILVGPDRDIPAPDVGTNAQVMAWFMDTLSMHRGYSVTASVTGKPVEV